MHRSIAIRCVIGALLVLGGIGAAPAEAQSVQTVVDEMKARYQQQLETVDTYVIETNQYTSYYRKTTRNGESVYETAMRWKGDGGGLFNGADAMPSLQPSRSQLDTLAQVASYVGTETIDGQRVHVLRVDDPAALSGDRMPAMEQAEQGEMRLYIDAERYVPLRMESEMTMTQNGETQTLRPRIVFSDYRTTDGLTLPWKMEMTVDSLNASVSPEEREQARQSLEELEARMKELPEGQRQMMEGMMKDQLDQLRGILEEGAINIAIEVQDVHVNAPLPEDVFSGSNN